MKLYVRAIGAIALIVTVAAPIVYLTGSLSIESCKLTLLATTIVWFAAALLLSGGSLEEA